MAASNDEVARAWFEACETGKGHAVCGQYQSDDATFECEGLPQIKLLSEYARTLAHAGAQQRAHELVWALASHVALVGVVVPVATPTG